MGNIIDYVKKHGHETFNERPFNDVDSLILAELAYLMYEHFVPFLSAKKKPVSLTQLTAPVLEKLISGTYAPLRNKNLVCALQKSLRFANIGLNYFVNDFDPKKDLQFSAITFTLIPKKLHYIAFRGTDLTFIGWKEDFNMAIMSETPSQQRSVLYLQRVAKLLKGGLLVGGHSKGGNLAYYSSFHIAKKYQKRIKAVYNHDGPGFRDNIYDKPFYKRIASRLHKTIPTDSIIGILLNYDDHYKIVKSTMVGLLQHDVFTWEVKGTDFVYKDKRTSNSLLMDKTLSDWLASADDETRAICIKELFEILTVDNSYSFKDLKKHTLKKLTLMFKQFVKVDPKTKEIMLIILSNLIQTWFKNFLNGPFNSNKKRAIVKKKTKAPKIENKTIN